MRVMIVGGGLTGSALGGLLSQERHQITVVEQREELVERLQRELPNAQIVLGDGCEPSVLERAGIRRADVVCAVTGHDEDNLVVCLLAKHEYGVRRTIGRVNNPKNEWLFTSEMGVDERVSQAHIMASLLREEMSSQEITVLMRLHQGDTAIVEDILRPDSHAAGCSVSDLELPEQAVLVAILRGEDLIIPRGYTVLQAGDRVVALVKAQDRDKLAQALN